VRLSWTSSNGAGTYDLYRNGALLASALAGSVSTFTDNLGLSVGKNYDYYLVARNAVGTQLSNTNTISIPTSVQPSRPDLALTNNTFTFTPASSSIGDTVILTLQVRNSGDAALPVSNGRVALRTTGASAHDVVSQLDSFDIASLDAGATSSITRSIRLTGIPQGQYQLAIVLTAPAEVTESSLLNNDVVASGVLEIAAAAGSPPTIVVPPVKAQTVLAGENVILSVAAQGQNLVYQWYRNENPINQSNSPTLNLAATLGLNSYNYSVQITNSSGLSVTSDLAHISVTTADSTPATVPPAVHSGELVGGSQINPDWATIVITHGWELLDPLAALPPKWTTDMAAEIRRKVPASTNILIYGWRDAYVKSLGDSIDAAYSNGQLLAKLLKENLGKSYDKPIQFIGHSLGTVVNGYAIEELRGYKQIQETTLDAPTKIVGIGESFFSATLPVAYMDNYYGDREESLTPAVGASLSSAQTNELFTGADHGDVHERFLTEKIATGSWTSIVNGLSAASQPAVTPLQSLSSGLPLAFQITTPANVTGTTPAILGQTVSGLQLTAPAPPTQTGKTAFSLAGPIPNGHVVANSADFSPAAEIASDIVVPSDATELVFDLHVEQLGDGAWLGVSFNGDSLLRFRGDATSDDDFKTVSVPIIQLAGQAGILRFSLNAAGTQAAQMTVANVGFRASQTPVVRTAPVTQTVTAGQTIALTAEAGGRGPFTYQWRSNGVPIAEATGSTFTLSNVQSTNAGVYDVVITNATGSVVSAAASVTVNSPSNVGRLINLSILTSVTASDPFFTVGTVIGGAGTSGSKPLLVRAAGPSLTAFGVDGALSDPKLDLFSGQTVIGTNDDWGGTAALSSAFSQVGAFAYAASNSKDAALSNAALASGAYTIQVSGAAGASGTVIAELYDATASGAFTATTPRLINVSVLKQISAGTTVTAGFVIGGTTSQTVLIRAVGPTLGTAPFNVSGVMADPKLDLFSGQTVIKSNDDWGTPIGTDSATSTQMSAAFTQVGAFALGANSKDAAILVTLQPGSYTAQVNGVGGTAGLALVEVYEVP
jgi:hypothetical protein